MNTLNPPSAFLSEDPTLISNVVTTEKSTEQHEVKIDLVDHMTPHQDPSNPFAFIPEQLSALVDPKNLPLLRAYGGVEGVAKGLHVDLRSGLIPNAPNHQPISLDQIINNKKDDSVFDADLLERTPTVHSLGARQLTHRTDITISSPDVTAFPQRRKVFGANILPETESKGILRLMWIAFQDKTLVSNR